MSSTFTVAILALLSIGICESANLAEITWKHDIKTKALLEEAYKSKFAYLNNAYDCNHFDG